MTKSRMSVEAPTPRPAWVPIIVGRMSIAQQSFREFTERRGGRGSAYAQRDVPGSVGTHAESISTSFLSRVVKCSPVKVFVTTPQSVKCT